MIAGAECSSVTGGFSCPALSSTWDLVGTGNQAWTVLGGTLLVDGTVGVVTVQNGGIAGGNGTVAGLAVNAGGTAAPGGTLAGPAIGTLNVAGNVSLPGARLIRLKPIRPVSRTRSWPPAPPRFPAARCR